MSPVDILRKQVRSDRGKSRAITEEVKKIILDRYTEFSYWSYQLHRDNLEVHLKNKKISPMPSYSTVRRFLQAQGKFKSRDSRNKNKKGYKKAQLRKENYEVRSYENDYVNGLWHLDFHHGSKQVITSQGELVFPICLAIIDDHSRLICHIQWYLTEKAEDIVHGFSQALQKRGIPRSLMTDNGSAMTSAEFTQGLMRLGIEHKTTLPYSPHQNGKQEVLWGQLEGRLLAMLANKTVLEMKELNDLTQAWSEVEYNKSNHREIKSTPLNRFLNHTDISRDCPDWNYLKSSFRREDKRRLRRSDGTIPIEGIRFEIPYQYKHFKDIKFHYAKWNLGFVHIVDQDSNILCRILPLDKSANSSGIRKKITIEESEETVGEIKETNGLPPLLEYISNEYTKQGLPPAYLPKDQ